jgi:hypothetical protein
MRFIKNNNINNLYFMKKFFLSTLALLTFGVMANAQMPYNIAVQNQTYTPLTSTTSINDTTKWDEEIFTAPLGFNFNINGKTINKFILTAGNALGTDTSGTIDGFSFSAIDLIDRGFNGNTSLSPIRYTVTGTTGSRIFKAEVFNAGFADELYNYSTLNDSLNYQVWLYEGTNVVEIHFGPSQITYASDYFPFGGPMVGFIKNADMSGGNFDKLYLLKGSATAPTVDSIEDGSMSFPTLSSYPSSGTVYRFTPKSGSTGISDKLVKNIHVYPTQSSDAIFIKNEDVTDTYYQVVSLNGATLKNGKVEKGENKIDISNLSSGMYILRMDNITGYDTRKFIKL